MTKKGVTMLNHRSLSGKRHRLTAGWIAVTLLIFSTTTAMGHGGKTHADEPFSAFQAAQKAAGLYDRLIVSGKLPEKWETDLMSIDITIRESGDQREYVVRFKRTGGDPDRVYFYFDRNGEYTGSNFTGQ
jgi:hypothetical protein